MKRVCRWTPIFFLVGGSIAFAANGSGASRNAWELLAFQAAVFGAIFTAYAAIRQWRRDAKWRHEDREREIELRRDELDHRKEDLRWRQAELATKLLDEIFDYTPSDDAWGMVDEETEFKDREQRKMRINMDDVRQALTLVGPAEKPKLLEAKDEHARHIYSYVRWCFDALFYYLERLERSIRIGVIRFEDLNAPTGYYIGLMAEDKELFRKYAEFIGFRGRSCIHGSFSSGAK